MTQERCTAQIDWMDGHTYQCEFYMDPNSNPKYNSPHWPWAHGAHLVGHSVPGMPKVIYWEHVDTSTYIERLPAKEQMAGIVRRARVQDHTDTLANHKIVSPDQWAIPVPKTTLDYDGNLDKVKPRGKSPAARLLLVSDMSSSSQNGSSRVDQS